MNKNYGNGFYLRPKIIHTLHKSYATLLIKQTSIDPQSGLSNEILCVHSAQGAAKVWEVKVGKVGNSSLLNLLSTGMVNEY